jgi:hypothetical protein
VQHSKQGVDIGEMRREKRRKDSAFIDTLVTVVGSKNTIGLIMGAAQIVV